MMLFHVTPAVNLPSIWTFGLTPQPAGEVRSKRIWLAKASRLFWAIVHISRHHGVATQDLVVLSCELPRSMLTRRRRGIWTTEHPIPASDLSLVPLCLVNNGITRRA